MKKLEYKSVFDFSKNVSSDNAKSAEKTAAMEPVRGRVADKALDIEEHDREEVPPVSKKIRTVPTVNGEEDEVQKDDGWDLGDSW